MHAMRRPGDVIKANGDERLKQALLASLSLERLNSSGVDPFPASKLYRLKRYCAISIPNTFAFLYLVNRFLRFQPVLGRCASSLIPHAEDSIGIVSCMSILQAQKPFVFITIQF
jgi:hypothetical protein